MSKSKTARFRDSDFVAAKDCPKFPDGPLSAKNPPLPPPVCVIVAKKGRWVAVRDSKDLSKKTLLFTVKEWNVFIGAVKKGEFDSKCLGLWWINGKA